MNLQTSALAGSDRTALVAGGAGFLGSHLCEQLIRRGWRVIALDNLQTGSRGNLQRLTKETRFEFLEHDICEPLPPGLTADLVFNLACAASPPRYQADPVHTMMTCVVGTNHLLAFAEANRAGFVQASTSEIYGDPELHPQPEAYWGNVNCTGPRACYDEGKRAAEALCFDYLRHGRTDVRVARIFNTYGPRMQPDDGRIVSNLICQALAGKPLTIYGTGEQTRSFCYVSDLVDGLVRLATVADNPREPVNLGNPGEFTINELAALVLAMTRSTSRIVHEPLPQDDPRRRRPDVTRAKELLDWAPKIQLARGLPPTIAWFSRLIEAESRPAAARSPARTAGRVPTLAVASTANRRD
ncbi:UDP-glucuronic acid decarboxylase family protein [Chthonobacter albigriseus]|uniref:UDP-glucuronic acid decarboxylase family protein n=1 Tax=Chthonobacter albigriseus TaxID=1683161 RepID=UPI0015EF3A46|nr:UDP-glucuronic acid decarboxylase family protein [Chthonobacter albigriseus]